MTSIFGSNEKEIKNAFSDIFCPASSNGTIFFSVHEMNERKRAINSSEKKSVFLFLSCWSVQNNSP